VGKIMGKWKKIEKMPVFLVPFFSYRGNEFFSQKKKSPFLEGARRQHALMPSQTQGTGKK